MNSRIIKKRKYKKTAKKRDTHSRLYLVMLVIFILIGITIFRIYQLQVLESAKYQKLANNQHQSRQEILPRRGNILIKEKEGEFSLAINQQLMTVFAVPDEIKHPKEVAEKIYTILALDKNKLIDKLAKENDKYEVLKRKLSEKEAQEIKKMNLTGIYLKREHWRYYPANDLAAHVVGFVGYNGNKMTGRYGVEQYFEKNLKGEKGLLEQEKDIFGRWISISNRLLKPEKNGQNLVLTLDHMIQFKAQEILKKAVSKHGADGGKIIIIEPYSGNILAMANYPTFNPNEYAKEKDMRIFINPIVSDEYECGSVFKTITMAAGLDSGKVTPQTTYFDSGVVKIAGYEIKNSDEKAHGIQTMTQIIEKSLNTGAIFVEKQMGQKVFKRYLDDFGFGKKTGIDLPGEVGGNLATLKSYRPIEFYTASFGQGITVTPLQLIMAYGAIANGGELVKPQIVDHLTSSSGQIQKITREIKRQVISRNTSNQISLMLESNIKNGHGKSAGVPGYRLGGKTGTAQIANKKGKGYLENATVGSFAGFGPIDNPIFAMLVIIDHPRDVEWAESTAAPIFGEMANFLLEYYNIKPTEEYTKKDMEEFNKKHHYFLDNKKNDKNQESNLN